MRPKSLLLLVLALGCGLVASIGISQVMDKGDGDAIEVSGETTTVYVAKIDIPMGEPFNLELMIEAKNYPSEIVSSDAITDLDDLIDRRARQHIYVGEVILAPKVSGDTYEGPSDYVKEGYRVVAVRVTIDSGGDLVNIGDRVDLQVFLRPNANYGIKSPIVKTFLKDIRVFMVGQKYATDPDNPDEMSQVATTIKFQVLPSQADLITLASKMGEVKLILRRPNDPIETDSKQVGLSDILGETPKTDRKDFLLAGKAEAPSDSGPSIGEKLLEMFANSGGKNGQSDPVDPVAHVDPNTFRIVRLTKNGPVVQEFTVNGVPIGGTATATDEEAPNDVKQPKIEMPEADNAAPDADSDEHKADSDDKDSSVGGLSS